MHEKGNGKDPDQNQDDQRYFEVLEDKFFDFAHPTP